jgi:hypothetical protein
MKLTSVERKLAKLEAAVDTLPSQRRRVLVAIVDDTDDVSPQAIERDLNNDHSGKPDRSTADANSENHKPKATTTCEGNNPSWSR